MDPQSVTPVSPEAAPAPQSQAPDLAALVAPPAAPAEAAVPQAQPQQTDPRILLAAQLLQEQQQRAQALEAQVEAAEAQRIDQWYNGLDEQMKPFGEWAKQAITAVKGKDRTIAELQRENALLKQTFTPYLVNDRLTQYSQQYGVPRQILEQYGASDPNVAEAVAKAAQALMKQQQFQQRAAANLDAAATPTMTASSTPSRDQIVEKFRGGQNGGLEAKLRALGQAGLR